jgi:hypothetical protein
MRYLKRRTFRTSRIPIVIPDDLKVYEGFAGRTLTVSYDDKGMPFVDGERFTETDNLAVFRYLRSLCRR